MATSMASRSREGILPLYPGYRLDIRKTFFTMRVAKHWNSVPRETEEAPSLEAFIINLDRALSNLVLLKMSLLTAGGLCWMTAKGAFQPKAFYDSIILYSKHYVVYCNYLSIAPLVP